MYFFINTDARRENAKCLPTLQSENVLCKTLLCRQGYLHFYWDPFLFGQHCVMQFNIELQRVLLTEEVLKVLNMECL